MASEKPRVQLEYSTLAWEQSKRPAHPLRQFLTHPLVILAFVYLVGNGIRFLYIRTTEWDQVYMLAARQLLAGQAELYRATKQMQHVFTYPPFMALVVTPFSLLPHSLGRAIWLGVNALAIVLIWQWCWALSGGQRFDRKQYLILILGLLCGMRFVQDGLDHQQTDLVIGALLIGGCVAIQHGRFMLAATVIGLAAAMKCTPLLFAAYFLWRRQWLAAMWLIALAVICNLLPNLISSPTGGGWWLALWFHNLIAPMGQANYRPGDWYSSVILNQSLSGAAYRFFSTQWFVANKSVQVAERAGAISPQMLKAVTLATEAVLMLIALLCFPRSRRQTESRPPVVSLQCSVILLLMLLLSPMSSKPHFCTMILPGLCLARIAIERKDRLILSILIATILVGNVIIPNLFGGIIGDIALWYGIVTWSALLLLVGCYLALLQKMPKERM